MRLQSRVALITGAGQGIGAACAHRFAQEGAAVMLVDVNAAQVADLAQSLTAQGHDAGTARSRAALESATAAGPAHASGLTLAAATVATRGPTVPSTAAANVSASRRARPCVEHVDRRRCSTE